MPDLMEVLWRTEPVAIVRVLFSHAFGAFESSTMQGGGTPSMELQSR